MAEELIPCRSCRNSQSDERIFFFQLKLFSGSLCVGEQWIPICSRCRRSKGEPSYMHVMGQASRIVWNMPLPRTRNSDKPQKTRRGDRDVVICPIGRSHPVLRQDLASFSLPLYLAQRGSEVPARPLPNQVFTVGICEKCLDAHGAPSRVITVSGSRERQIVFENSPALIPIDYRQ